MVPRLCLDLAVLAPAPVDFFAQIVFGDCALNSVHASIGRDPLPAPTDIWAFVNDMPTPSNDNDRRLRSFANWLATE